MRGLDAPNWHNCEVYQCSADVRPYHEAITETAKVNYELELEEQAKALAEKKIDPAHFGSDPAIG